MSDPDLVLVMLRKLDAKVDTLDSKAGKIEADVAEIKGDVSELKATVSGLDIKVDALQHVVLETSSHVHFQSRVMNNTHKRHEKAIDDLRQRVSKLESKDKSEE